MEMPKRAEALRLADGGLVNDQYRLELNPDGSLQIEETHHSQGEREGEVDARAQCRGAKCRAGCVDEPGSK